MDGLYDGLPVLSGKSARRRITVGIDETQQQQFTIQKLFNQQ